MAHRIWYPQLDVFDCIRRICILLSFRDDQPISIERLLIADLFLSSPPLLHSVSMPSEVRKHFGELGVRQLAKSFLDYPAAPLLFHKMEPVQRRALHSLVSKNVLDSERYARRELCLTKEGLSLTLDKFKGSDSEIDLAKFLMTELVILSQDNIEDLRKRTGLRRLAA
jgi:hypothetical protein